MSDVAPEPGPAKRDRESPTCCSSSAAATPLPSRPAVLPLVYDDLRRMAHRQLRGRAGRAHAEHHRARPRGLSAAGRPVARGVGGTARTLFPGGRRPRDAPRAGGLRAAASRRAAWRRGAAARGARGCGGRRRRAGRGASRRRGCWRSTRRWRGWALVGRAAVPGGGVPLLRGPERGRDRGGARRVAAHRVCATGRPRGVAVPRAGGAAMPRLKSSPRGSCGDRARGGGGGGARPLAGRARRATWPARAATTPGAARGGRALRAGRARTRRPRTDFLREPAAAFASPVLERVTAGDDDAGGVPESLRALRSTRRGVTRWSGRAGARRHGGLGLPGARPAARAVGRDQGAAAPRGARRRGAPSGFFARLRSPRS